MKKIFALILSAVILGAGAVLISSCGGDDDASASPTPSASVSPAPTTSASASADTTDGTDTTDAANAGDSGTIIAGNIDGNNTATDVPSNNEITTEQISIINGTSIDFYELYLSESSLGNLGENIISGSVFAEGEELVLPYANFDASTPLMLIAADESGKQYVLENFPISNGAVIEIRLNGSVLEAIVQ